MPEPIWVEGFSKTSIGRFGGFRDDVIPYNSGYLTANATATRVYLHDGDRTEELGWYQLPRDFCQKTETSWVGNRYTFTTSDGEPHSTVTRSLLYPGFHHEVRTGVFEYYFRVRGYGPSVMVLPLESGLRQVTATDGYDPERDGRLAKPWILYYWCDSAMPFDYPMLLTFDREPRKIELWCHEYVKVHFADRAATVVQAHPFGAERLDKDVTRRWRDGLPSGLEERFDLFSRAALAYPYRCREEFLIDESREVVRIRDEYEYLESSSEWKLEPLHLAPLPPLVANLRNLGYPVAVKGEVIERICPTFSGWYEAVRGKVLEYEIPLSRFRNLALAPVKVEHNPLADEIADKLASYLESGEYLTFGGDDDYDPDCPLDSLHDLRIMAWSLHSIPQEKRKKALEMLSRGLARFGPQAYLSFDTTHTGTKWARDRTIFANRAVVDYDFEWYNGMNLAGLWAYDYFGGSPESTKLIREHWSLISGIFAYAKGYADWANLLAWTCARGESTWLDGINYMYEGALGYAALARKLGRADDAAWGDYCSAKLEAFICNCWLAGPYYREHFPQEDGVEPVCASGYWEGRPVGYHDQTGWSCGNYGYCVRELLVLFKDLGIEDKLRRSFAGFERNFPHWRGDPYASGKASGYPGFDERRTIHHYFLDPRLIVSAVVLGEDVRHLMEVGAPLTAPVLESYLVALAPKLLVPRDAELLGAVWDDKARKLTVKLAGDGKRTLALAHSGNPTVTSGDVMRVSATEGRALYEAKLEGETEISFQY